MDPERLDRAYQTALSTLLAERTPDGHWTGELSTSALSTATAVSALALVQRHAEPPERFDHLIAGGLAWLAAHQNADGGWGDTLKSISNISTTMLCRATFHIASAAERYPEPLRRAEAHLGERYGKTPEELAEAVRARYGKDRTFAVPILTTCALAGLVKWNEVQTLPFELACCPQAWFRFLRLPVVSYALPALIAIGQAIYRHRPPRNPVTRVVRRLAVKRSLRVLQAIQPSSGGFIEAVPLTSFVTLSLASIGLAEHPVARLGVKFLVDGVRPDGSWPIDSNLATWVTTLSINALAAAGEAATLDQSAELRDWLLRQQLATRHPYTGADPGGWGWTDLPGSVPDADDTPGALLALLHLEGERASVTTPTRHPSTRPTSPTYDAAEGIIQKYLRHRSRFELDEKAVAGIEWLLGLQNRDGGWPTFCRGWGELPFDRSGPDLTAHVLRALRHWGRRLAGTSFLPRLAAEGRNGAWSLLPRQHANALAVGLRNAIDRGLAYLAAQQRADGSWLPLWFGNQYATDDENPTYGTARVLAAYRDLDKMDSEPARRGVAWLLGTQNDDGGWGGCAGVPSSMEETALAVEVLLDAGPGAASAVNNGLTWLVQHVEQGCLHDPVPIGFYFAKLWYFEKLYPMIFTVAALGRARRKESERPGADLARRHGTDAVPTQTRREHTP